MADSIQTILADPDYQKLSPAGQRKLVEQVEPDAKGLSDAGYQKFISGMTPAAQTNISRDQPGFFSRLGSTLNPMNMLNAYGEAISGTGNPLALPMAGLRASSQALSEGANPAQAALAPVPVLNDLSRGNVSGASGQVAGGALLGKALGKLGGGEVPPEESTPSAVSKTAKATSNGKSTVDLIKLGAKLGARRIPGVGLVMDAHDALQAIRDYINPSEDLPSAPKAVRPPPLQGSSLVRQPQPVTAAPPPVQGSSLARVSQTAPMTAPPPLQGSSIPPVQPTAPQFPAPPLQGSSIPPVQPPAPRVPIPPIRWNAAPPEAGPAATPATSPVQPGPVSPVTVPGAVPQTVGTVVPENAATFRHSAPYTDLIRQFHAQWPKGTSLRDMGSEVFGTKAGEMPSYEQAQALHEWMVGHNWKAGMKLPSAKDLGM